jgi:hypothetical protein
MSDVSAVADFEIPGVLRVRARDASSDDLAAVARDVGSARAATREPADVTVRFVDELSPASLRMLDGGTMGYDDERVYFLEGTGHRAVAGVTLGERWGEALIVCRRGARRVPFLSAAVDFAALARGWAPVHGSGWVTPGGSGVVVAGWARSGKTGALLEACEAGATPVGDDRVLLSRDGSRMIGLGRPIEVKRWHLAQLALPALGGRPLGRAVAKGTSALAARLTSPRERAPGRRSARLGLAYKVLGRFQTSSNIELDVHLLRANARALAEARPDALIILESHHHPSVVAERADSRTVPSRLAAQMTAELMPTLRGHLAFEYARPGRGWKDVGRAPEVAQELLSEAIREVPANLVRHPYPCSLRELGDVIREAVASAPPRNAP